MLRQDPPSPSPFPEMWVFWSFLTSICTMVMGYSKPRTVVNPQCGKSGTTPGLHTEFLCTTWSLTTSVDRQAQLSTAPDDRQMSWNFKLRKEILCVILVFFFFCTMVKEKKRGIFCGNFMKNSEEKLVKCATKVARLHKVSIQSCTQNRPSPKVQSCSGDFYRLDYLYETWHTCSPCSRLQNGARARQIFQFLPRDLNMVFQSRKKKRCKIITKLWKIMTKSLGKIKKSGAIFGRSALLFAFCENRFRLSQLVKQLNSR